MADFMADFNTATLNYGMISGSAEAQSRKYHKTIGKSGTVWLYADQLNSGDNVYSHTKPKGIVLAADCGFGGRILKFPLVDGTVYEANGPWHSNAVAMWKDTGIDLRQTHLTQVIIGKTRKWRGISMHGIIKDVLYKDNKPTLGYFKRGDYLAAEIATKLGHNVVISTFSYGGSSSKTISPNSKVDKDEDKW